ncbi:MAG: sulfotransferase, partial [Candidatus Thiodiazotropha sp.]
TSIQSQLDYLIDLEGKVLVDFIGHYENLSDDFNTITQRIGAPNLKLPHKRKAMDRKKDYRSYYSDEMAALVGDHFRKDIEGLGYSFDP